MMNMPGRLLLMLTLSVIAGCGSNSAGPPVPLVFNLDGKITYDSVPHGSGSSALDYVGTSQKPVRGAVVEAVSGSTVIASATTDAGGNYSITYSGMVPANLNVVVRVRARLRQTGTPSWDFQVVDNTSAGAAYVMTITTLAPDTTTTATIDANAPSGWGGSGYNATRSAAPFAILDQVYDALNKVFAVDASVNFQPLNLNWSVNNVPAAGNKALGQITTSHWDGTALYILGAENVDTDEYDTHVVLHEWGHYFESTFSRSDSIDGSHTSGDRLDMRVAFSEGLGNALSAMISDDPLYKDSMGANQAGGFGFDIESNTVSNPGWYSEASVQSVLYDLYDANADTGDSVALGFAPVYNVLTGAFKTGDTLTSIFSFMPPLIAANPAETTAIQALLTAQGIDGNIDTTGSTETNNAATASHVLPVYTAVTAGGPAVEVCTLNKFEWNPSAPDRNKLSYNRYLRFNAPSTRTYSVSVSTTSSTSFSTNADPDIYLYSSTGLIGAALSYTANSESMTTPTLASGQNYVLVVTDYNLAGATGAESTCMNVTVN